MRASLQPVTAPDRLRERLAEVHDLSRAASLLGWDERTKMPPAGAAARADQLATLAKVRHELFCSEEVGELIATVRGEAAEDSVEADLARVAGRDWDKARLVPSELRAEMAHASAVAEHAWVDAKRDSDFGRLLPHLERNVELVRRFADCYRGFPGFSDSYDPLLDEYEPEMSTAQISAVLAELRQGLVPLVAELPIAGAGSNSDALRGSFPEDAQRA